MFPTESSPLLAVRLLRCCWRCCRRVSDSYRCMRVWYALPHWRHLCSEVQLTAVCPAERELKQSWWLAISRCWRVASQNLLHLYTWCGLLHTEQALLVVTLLCLVSLCTVGRLPSRWGPLSVLEALIISWAWHLCCRISRNSDSLGGYCDVDLSSLSFLVLGATLSRYNWAKLGLMDQEMLYIHFLVKVLKNSLNGN